MSPIPERDALQPERTALAWQRTAITAMVAQVPLALVALRTDRPVLAAGGALAMAGSVVLVGTVRRRLVQLRDDERGYSPSPPMLQVAVLTVLAALGGVALGLAAWLG
ncbi:protein of unknown function [Pedococcus dokdonensis]|uniref:DUF202 domain-containing protein n=1 Tax=Pedococcus dokdonensis TaxID=443156 RepID=A0A1H0P8G3_9MICO|nr:DUF202 domain-containing protein [Pedococcus dokdonensis]SDP01251.1 protein of unknown function [Pedococcus dokdonensis]